MKSNEPYYGLTLGSKAVNRIARKPGRKLQLLRKKLLTLETGSAP